MITINQLTKRFRKMQALNNINAEMHRGQAIALVGPNGSGKTTLIKCILGLVKPQAGEISVDGMLVSGDVSYRDKIGYMPQIGRYPDNMKVGQLFSMIRNIRSAGKIDEELYFRFALDTIQDKSMRSLSGGTRQKVSAALAFLFNPDILILDEPTAGLDPLSSEILKTKINNEKSEGKLILVTSHVLSDLEEVCTHIMYLQEGKLEFYKEIQELLHETGEEKLAKAIAWKMKQSSLKNELTYLKIAK